MSGYYSGKIKVVCPDKMCFPVDPQTLDALSTGCYDPYPYQEEDALEVISVGVWNARCEKLSRG